MPAVSTSAPQCRAGAAVQGSRTCVSNPVSGFCQVGELQGWKVDRERGCQGVFKFEGKLCGVKCAGAVSAVFRGESLLGEL